MKLVERAKNIVASPRTEWDAIAADTTPTKELLTGYVLPLAAAAAIAAMLGMVFIGQSMPFLGTYKWGFGTGLAIAIFNIVMAVVMIYVVGFIVDALAPTFGGQKSLDQAIKVVAYAYTPVWLIGILAIIPALGLLGIIGGIYAIYLLYLGLPRLMRNPPDKSAGYTALVVVCAIVVGFIISMIAGLITAPAMMGAAAMGGSSEVTFEEGSAGAKLDQFAKKMEEAAKKMEEAEKSGDPKKQMEAAMAALGTAVSGGKGVEPVQLDALKPFLPEKFAGLPRTDVQAERGGMPGLMAAKVSGIYADGDKQVELEVVDTGGAAGLTSLAAWASLGGTAESETADRVERMRRDGNRMVREEISKRKDGTNLYAVILADRFMVSAEGQGVPFETLKSAVGGIDLGKLEALK